ncbi:MAG: CGNR zinc finger domain-containing protein [Solirubrobacteraceae bacterium]|jgi:predicted RNA-binding Zn ribbon-like protein
MTGESALPTPLQPGGRAPAPGELAVVQAFVNTHYDLEIEHGAELLGSPSALAAWLRRYGLLVDDVELGAAELSRVLALREGLRALARANASAGDGRPLPVPGSPADASAIEAINAAVEGAFVEIRFGVDQPRADRAWCSRARLQPAAAGVDHAVAAIASITAGAIFDRSWARLKVCAGEHCGWAFYDHSRNLTGKWCSMLVCGGRAKARAQYYRRRPPADDGGANGEG